MNIYFVVILTALLVIFAIETWAEWLNVQTLKGDIPDEFKGVFDPDKYAKSLDYTRTKTNFGLIVSSFHLIVLLVFWLFGGFNYLDGLVRGWGFSPIVTGLLFFGILFLANDWLSLPFSIYSTFVIEEKFGFNKTTVKTFMTDRIKAYALTAVLGGVLAAGILAFFQWTGAWAWVYCWAGVTVFGLFVQFIAPTWIMPLFNKFTPLGEGELRTAIFDYAKSVSFSLKNIFVMDGSKRSSKSNAFFTGFGKNKRIALFDTLIEKHSVPELVSVLAHEIGHYKKKHVLKGMVLGFVQHGIVFYLLSVFISRPGLFEAFQMENMSVYAGLVFFGIFYSPISFVLSVAMNVFSRHNEYEADAYASTTYGQPESMIRALKTLSISNLIHLRPHPFYVFLNYSHPPVLERIQAIRKRGGERG